MRFPLSGHARDLHPLDYTHVGRTKKKEIREMDFLFLVETKGFEPLTSAMWLQRSKPAGLRLYFRLAMQSNKKFGDLATYWRFFLSWSGIFSGFS